MTKKLALFGWMQSFPERSRERLCHINAAASHAGHVVLALTYGAIDPYIRHVNRIISSLLLRQLQAGRAGDSAAVERLACRLSDLHVAIDWITGVCPPLTSPSDRNLHEVCNRVAPKSPKRR